MPGPSETADAAGWTRVETRAAFVAAFADRPLEAPRMAFVIHASGRLAGTVSAANLVGRWEWREGLFCRRAWLDSVDLGLDREVIERCGYRMRYTGDAGRAEPRIVSLCAVQPPG